MRMKLKEERWKEKKEGKDEEAFTILQANTPTPTQKQKQKLPDEQRAKRRGSKKGKAHKLSHEPNVHLYPQS